MGIRTEHLSKSVEKNLLFSCILAFSGHLIYLPFTLCLTVPSQFTNTLREFASEGFRVLALAYKEVDAHTDLSSIER